MPVYAGTPQGSSRGHPPRRLADLLAPDALALPYEFTVRRSLPDAVPRVRLQPLRSKPRTGPAEAAVADTATRTFPSLSALAARARAHTRAGRAGTIRIHG